MKMKHHLARIVALASTLAFIGSTTSCMNTYDANGRSYQTVDPGLAIAGVAAAGLIGYAAGNSHGGHRGQRSHHSYDDGGVYYGGSSYNDGYSYRRSGRERSR